jgi:hypothetical protein
MASEYGWNEDRRPVGRGGGDDADFWRARREQRLTGRTADQDRSQGAGYFGGRERQEQEFGRGGEDVGYRGGRFEPDYGAGAHHLSDEARDASLRSGYGRDQGRDRFGGGFDRARSSFDERSFAPYDSGIERGGRSGQERDLWREGRSSDVFADDEAKRRRFGADAGAEHGLFGSHRGRGPKGYTRSDERIREDVHDVLTDDPQLDATHITAEVSGAEVTLNGHVVSRRDKRRAEDIIERVSGVRHVQNNLRVHDSNYNAATASAGGPAAAGPLATAAPAETTSAAAGAANAHQGVSGRA